WDAEKKQWRFPAKDLGTTLWRRLARLPSYAEREWMFSALPKPRMMLARPIYEQTRTIAWEGDRIFAAVRDKVISVLTPEEHGVLTIFASETDALREHIAGQVRHMLKEAGLSFITVRVMPAYQQAYHALTEIMLPELLNLEDIVQVTVNISAGMDDPQYLGGRCTWVPTLQPALEEVGKRLGLPPRAVQLGLVPPGAHPKLQVTAYNATGTELYTSSFSLMTTTITRSLVYPQKKIVVEGSGIRIKTVHIERTIPVETDAQAAIAAYEELLQPATKFLSERARGVAVALFSHMTVEIVVSEPDLPPVSLRVPGILAVLDELHEEVYFAAQQAFAPICAAHP
ncbi:MAG: hypothetical protein OWS74_03680, partial [Firmicutes bacterium]|nr:hypothetical protein [Bacillota bacterium]